jgi:DNA-binding NarL/FixJ family response regulator
MDHRSIGMGIGLSSDVCRVLELMATGHSSAEVAVHLGTTPDVVRQRAAAAIVALGAHSKLEAILRAADLGLIELPGPRTDR